MRKSLWAIGLMAVCACGDKSSNGDSDNTDTDTEVACATDTTQASVLIGTTFGITGGQAADPLGKDQMPLVKQLVNDGCGVGGTLEAGAPIDYQINDSLSTGPGATAALDQLQAAGAVAFLGAGNSTATIPYADRAVTVYNKVIVTNVGASETLDNCTPAQLADSTVTKTTDPPPNITGQCWNNHGMFFRTRDQTTVWGQMAARYAHAQFPTLTQAAHLYRDDGVGRPLDTQLNTEFTSLGGTMTQRVAYPSGATQSNAEDLIKTLTTNDPTIVFITPVTGTFITIMNAWADLSANGSTGWTKPSHFDTLTIVVPQSLRGSDYSAMTAAGRQIMSTRATGVQLFWDVNAEGFKRWYQLWTDFDPTQSDPVSQTRPGAFDGNMLLALALTKAGTTDSAAIAAAMVDVANPPGTKFYPDQYKEARAAILNGEDIDYEGPAIIDFDPRGDPSVFVYAIYTFDVSGTSMPVSGLVTLDNPVVH